MPRKREQFNENYGKAFPKNMRELMENETQQTLADALGKSRQAISYYCDGSSSPDWETLVKIANYFHVSTDWLLGRTDIKSAEMSEKVSKEFVREQYKVIDDIDYLNEMLKEESKGHWIAVQCANYKPHKFCSKLADSAFKEFIKALIELLECEFEEGDQK